MSKVRYISKHNQSLMDVAINQYGGGSYVFQLLADNPGLDDIGDLLPPGTSLWVDSTEAEKRTENEFRMASVVTRIAPIPRTEVVVKQGQSLSDIAIEYYGDLSHIFQVLQDNPQLQSTETVLEEGDRLKVNSSIAENKAENEFEYLNTVKPSPEPALQPRLVYEGQSTLDLALQEYGDISAAIELLLDLGTDNIGSLTAPEAGASINIRKDRVIDSDVTTYYQNRNIKINTGKLVVIEGIGLCSSDGVLLVSFDNFILNASDL